MLIFFCVQESSLRQILDHVFRFARIPGKPQHNAAVAAAAAARMMQHVLLSIMVTVIMCSI